MSAIAPPSSPLPEASIKMAEDQVKYGNPIGFPSYVASERTPLPEATSRLEYMREHFSRDGAAGYPALAVTLERGQTYNTGYTSGDPAVAATFRGAFSNLVNEGAWTAADTKGIVAAEADHRTGVMEAHTIGKYFTALQGPNAREARADFVRESYAAAARLEVGQPGSGAALYAQTTQVLGSMKAPELIANLDALRAGDRDAVAKLAYGSMGGTAQLAANLETGNRVHPGTYAADGLGKMLGTLADAKAQSELQQAVHGVSEYMTEKRGTSAETAVLEHDGQTDLRSALERASEFTPGGRSNFSALLEANHDATGLSGQISLDGGMDLIANLSRAELGGSQHDASANRHKENLGNVIGTLAVDLAVSTPGQDGRLERDFGRGAFSGNDAETRELAAARTLGNTFAQIDAGLNQDFDIRNQAAQERQEALKGAFEKIAALSEAGAKLKTPASEHLEALAGAAEKIADQIPRDRVLTSEHTREYLKELGSSVNTLLDGRPDLQNQFKNGLNDTTTWQYNADKAREREAVNEAADVSGGLAGRFVAKIVAPQTVEPKGPPPLTKEEAFDPLRGAIDRYNADPAHKGHSLPQPSDPNALRMRGDGPTAKYNQTGTMLQFDVGGGEREYAMYACTTAADRTPCSIPSKISTASRRTRWIRADTTFRSSTVR